MWAFIVKGGPLMYPLMAVSVIALTVIIDRFWYWWREGGRFDRSLAERIISLAGQGDLSRAQEICQEAGDPVCRVLRAGALHIQSGPERAMEQAASTELARMRRLMVVLDTMITVAPLLGILGTVTGIIYSFDMLGASQGQVGNPREVISGIAQALITTAGGLTISVCCLFPYNYFQNRAERMAELMERWGTRLELGLGGKPKS